MYEHDNTFHWQQAKDVANAWGEFFGPAGLGSLPDEIRYFCCAQFVVRRRHIQRHPREFYLQVKRDACNSLGTQTGWLSHVMLNSIAFLPGYRAEGKKAACQAKPVPKKTSKDRPVSAGNSLVGHKSLERGDKSKVF